MADAPVLVRMPTPAGAAWFLDDAHRWGGGGLSGKDHTAHIFTYDEFNRWCRGISDAERYGPIPICLTIIERPSWMGKTWTEGTDRACPKCLKLAEVHT